jgi:glutamyl-tRNA reductase
MQKGMNEKMQIVAVGLNHTTAPVSLREQLALNDCGLRMALSDLAACRRMPANGNGQPRLLESVILSTCNRLEVYAVVAGSSKAGWRRIEHFLADLQGLDLETLSRHLYYLDGQAAVDHLMRVAAGLDSMILGEAQILGQVSAAQSEAQTAGCVGPIMSHLFDHASHAGKRARTETEIGRHTTSISHAAAQLVCEQLGSLEGVQALIVGAGEMAQVAAQALRDRGLQQMSFINRTHSRAEALASHFGGRALNWYHLPSALAVADVVICSTGAPHIVIHENDVRPGLVERAGRPLLFVDIAVPRDVEDSVGHLPGVQRFDIDHLQLTVDANIAQRQAAIPEVEAIIAAEATRFESWLQGRQVLPVLVELRQHAQRIAVAELEKHQPQLDDLDPECQEKVTRLVHRIVSKLLHEPTVRLKASAAEGNGVEYAQALRELFDLDVVAPAIGSPPLTSPPDGNGAVIGQETPRACER